MKIIQSESSKKQTSGFTLVELLLVLTILAILAGVVLPKFTGKGEQAREAAAQAQIHVFSTALAAYEIDNSSFPATLNELVVQPRNAPHWKGPYLDMVVIPLDPWGHAYVYTAPGKHSPTSFDISSTCKCGNLYSTWTLAKN